MQVKKVTIIGLGLIGGSLARALRERLDITDIVAVNKSSESLDQALKDGVISKGLTDLDDSIWDSDIIFICTPVKRAMQYIDRICGKVKKGCIITDVGSTKSEIIEYINNLPDPPLFIGGHPMAGAEKTGYSSSFAHLFENAYYILSPSKTTEEWSIKLMLDFVEKIGAIPIVLDARKHDWITGCISHAPHVIASALVNMVKEQDSHEYEMQLLAAGGFKDITRIASSSPEMWENIISSNRNQIIQVLDNYIAKLECFKNNVINNEAERVFEFFQSAKQYRDSFPSSRNGLIEPQYDIVADVLDKPGIIGEIATILGLNGINIKNINVSNSREFEQGCLRISLSDYPSVNIAFDLLSNKGYKVFKC
ncbi:MAG TPA: prephenate dehydrogenase [Clostridia bacterium]|nr:prephenate dehydrogenase [Clostridia bacterium]